MLKELNLVVSPEQAANEEFLLREISHKLAIETPFEYRIKKRSVDARSRQIKINLTIEVYTNGEKIPFSNSISRDYKEVTNSKKTIIIGAGPAGLFAALKLIELGIKPVIFERGKDVRERRRDLAAINREHIVNPDSNYCFGEGGAGTYSDGKLYTRSTKRGDVNSILETLVYHGADETILVEAHPHIGTNKLPNIIVNIRERIINSGGEIHFNTRVTDFIIQDNVIKGVLTQNVLTASIDECAAENVILATGHSARDIFQLLHTKNILIEAKPFAIGVRIEHPQSLIDSIQYHCRTDNEVEKAREYLPAASYSLVHQVESRGVFSFCMCPGGIIAPCATSPGEVVTNGWSPSKRNNPYANSGTVVAIEQEDMKAFSKFGPLAGLEYQRSVEKMAFEAGGFRQSAPAQRMVDFVSGKLSSTLPRCSYQPGITSAPLNQLLPKHISFRLQQALVEFGKKMRGYYTNEAVLVGVESRTSSPVKIPRDKETLQHPQIKGLYPCGEGAGYAGGIVSAAIDGEKCALKVMELFEQIR